MANTANMLFVLLRCMVSKDLAMCVLCSTWEQGFVAVIDRMKNINMFQSHALNLPFIAFDNPSIHPSHCFSALPFNRQSRL